MLQWLFMVHGIFCKKLGLSAFSHNLIFNRSGENVFLHETSLPKSGNQHRHTMGTPTLG